MLLSETVQTKSMLADCFPLNGLSRKSVHTSFEFDVVFCLCCSYLSPKTIKRIYTQKKGGVYMVTNYVEAIVSSSSSKTLSLTL